MANALFTTKVNPASDDLPKVRYHFPSTYLNTAQQTVGDWILNAFRYRERPISTNRKETGPTVAINELRAYLAQLISEEEYEPEEGRWTFRSGGTCSCCTDSATKIAERFGGRAMGYCSLQNPSAYIGTMVCEGHDFAIVSERFIVDYWAYRIRRVMADPILDLQQPKHRQLVRYFYGDHELWREIFPRDIESESNR